MPYGPGPWGVVVTELAFLLCALKFLQIFTQARKPASTALGAMEGTEFIGAIRNTFQMENDRFPEVL